MNIKSDTMARNCKIQRRLLFDFITESHAMILLCMPLQRRIFLLQLGLLLHCKHVTGALQIHIIVKTKYRNEDWQLMSQVLRMAYQQLCDESVKNVEKISYLGDHLFFIASEMEADVKVRIGKAENAFGSLAVSRSQSSRKVVNCAAYKAVVLIDCTIVAMISYKCWPVKAYQVCQLEVSHHRCMWCILGVSTCISPTN